MTSSELGRFLVVNTPYEWYNSQSSRVQVWPWLCPPNCVYEMGMPVSLLSSSTLIVHAFALLLYSFIQWECVT